MVDHTSSREEINAYWLEKNSTSRWDQGHTHYVDPNEDEVRRPSDCPACRDQMLDGIEGDIDFWDAPWYSEDEIRKAFGGLGIAPMVINFAIEVLKNPEDDDE